ncbi:hypothetical protein [Kaarinaea lacus]
MLKIFTVLIMVFLLGCHHGSSDSNTVHQNVITGVYFGQFVIDGSGSSNLYALISENNNIRFMFDLLSGQGTGQLINNADLYSATLALYQNHEVNTFHSKSTEIQVETSITDGFMNGAWNNSISSGRIHLNKLSDEGQIIDPTQLSSNWIVNMASSGGSLFTLSLSIDSQGIISGSDTTGCTYHGNIVDINQTGRIVPIDLTLNSCGSENGDYHGLVTAISSTQGDVLILLASNDTYSITVGLNRS